MKIKPFSTIYQNNKEKFEGIVGEEIAETMYDIIVSAVRQNKPKMDKLRQYILKQTTTNTYAKNKERYAFFEGLMVAYNMMVKPHEEIKQIPKPDVWLDDITAKVADMDNVKKIEK